MNKRVANVLGASALAFGLLVAGCKTGDQPANDTGNKNENPPADTAKSAGGGEAFQPAALKFTAEEAAKLAPDMKKELLDGQREFAIRLFHNLAMSGEFDLNISPYSVSTALAMTYNAAKGNTATGMAATLGYPKATLEEVNKFHRAQLAAMLSADESVQLAVANAIFANKGKTFKQDFLQRDSDYYGARVQALDFNDKATLGIINGWVKENTREKIDTILDAIAPEDVMYLINAIYFKGPWNKAFEKGRTKDADFSSPSGILKVKMMHSRESLPYYDGKNFQMAELPFGEKSRYGMVFIKPKEKSPAGAGKDVLREFVMGLTANDWKTWTDGMKTKTVIFSMPRFKLEYKSSLKPALSTLGMDVAFSRNADFTGAREQNDLFISDVLHKTYIKVNEEGAEAAAVTAVVFATKSVAEPEEPVRMTLDQPFMYAIRDRVNGTILFMGMVNTPRE